MSRLSPKQLSCLPSRPTGANSPHSIPTSHCQTYQTKKRQAHSYSTRSGRRESCR